MELVVRGSGNIIISCILKSIPNVLDFLLEEEPEAGDCELSLFYKAAWRHRHFVLRELLTDLGLLE